MSKKRTKKKTDNSKIGWLILCIVLALLIFFTVTKTGRFGIFTNNLFTYIFGSLYIIPIAVLFIYGIFYVFSNDSYYKSKKVKWGIVVIDIFAVLLSAYIADEIHTFSELAEYTKNNFAPISQYNLFSFTGGLLGNLFYIPLNGLLSRIGTLISIIALFFISAILLIPVETAESAYENTRSSINEYRSGSEERKEARRLRKEEKERIRKQRQAEKMAEKEEKERLLREQEEQELQRRLEEEERRRLEEERKEAEKQRFLELKEKEKIRNQVYSNSSYFIHLTDKELGGYRPEVVKEEIVTSPVVEDSIPVVRQVNKKPVSSSEPKVLKPTHRKGAYHLPRPFEKYLEPSKSNSSSVNKTSASFKGEKVIEILHNFGIEAELLNTYIGPSVTKFEIKPDSSVKINRIMNISDNIKMELAARDIRIEAPMPGRSAVGIEIPNVEPIPVKMLDLMNSVPKEKKETPLLFALGKDLMGQAVFCDLAKMPHLLIAGATGSGKSVCINSIITSYLLRTNPDDVKLVLVDPKKVEFTPYKDIPHLIWPIIDDAQMASNMLKKVVVMMEERYDLFAQCGVRNIEAYNEKVIETKSQEDMPKLPYMVVIIDELADLMAIAGKEVELSIQRITQLARASGIHLIVATQRPSTDVITGLIKSNIPSRISFAVASSIDSRTILDQTGAERLLGNGDMLYYPQGETAPIRMQGVFVTDKEISKITTYVKEQAAPEYEDSYYEFLTNMNGTTVMNGGAANADSMDSLYDEVVEFVKMQQKASTSLLQRRFGIGYNRAARLIDTLEDRGVIGPANGAKPREVYLKPDSIDGIDE